MNEIPHPDTAVVALGRPARTPGAPVNPDVPMSSTFVGYAEPDGVTPVYGRLGNPGWTGLEELLGGLERGTALLYGSGMAAVSAGINLLAPGGRIVIARHTYHAALVVAREVAARTGGTVTEVDIADTAAVLAALDGAPAGSLLWVESPTNPMLDVADLPALAAGAHARGALVIADNTFATPLVQRPLTLGVDVVVHSVTKYLSGHSDVVLGAAVTADPDLLARLRAHRDHHGAIAGPWDAWLALRGARTLALRLERAQANAAELARRFERHPHVVALGYPGLPSHPQHERASAQMDGFGAILTLRPVGGAAGAEALARAVRLWVPATSLGGVESTLERRRRFASEAPTVPEDLLRLSVGIENVEDLAADLERGLAAAAAV